MRKPRNYYWASQDPKVFRKLYGGPSISSRILFIVAAVLGLALLVMI